MPPHQVQNFSRHTRIATTQMYAQTSMRGMGESDVRALGAALVGKKQSRRSFLNVVGFVDFVLTPSRNARSP